MSLPGDDLLYKTTTLNRIVDDLRTPTQSILDKIFVSEQRFTTEEIQFDTTRPNLTLAPFVSPMVQGKIIQEKGYETSAFRPANIKTKTALDQNRAISRQRGEQIGGTLSPRQRAQIQLADNLMQHQDLLANRLEWMACQTLVSDGYTVSGEDYPAKSISFGRPDNYSKTLTGNYLWTSEHANANPENYLQEVSELMAKNGSGRPTMLIMGNRTWTAFRNNKWVKERLDRFRAEAAAASFTPTNQVTRGLDYKGVYDSYTVYTHMDWYVDDDGDTQPYLPQNCCIIIDPAAYMGHVGYGLIRDATLIEAGDAARSMYVKSWIENDPGQRVVLCQSAPLVYTYRSHACFYLEPVA